MPNVKKTILFDVNAILDKIDAQERQKIAELGCGNFGFFTFPLAHLVGRRGQVFAVDILKPVLAEIKAKAIKENLPQIIPVWTNLEILNGAKIDSNSLDSAILINVLYQSDKYLAILKEAARMIKNRGSLLIIDWKMEDSPIGPPKERRIKIDALKSQALKLGLNIKEEFSAGPYHYGLLLLKS